jgi:hypothetical protein
MKFSVIASRGHGCGVDEMNLQMKTKPLSLNQFSQKCLSKIGKLAFEKFHCDFVTCDT